MPRVILVSGKGGVGKTTVSAATALASARAGHKTHVMSLDSAHSLADAFDLDQALFDKKGGDPFELEPNLSMQEIDVQEELKRHWQEIFAFFSTVFKASGLSGVVAEELAVFPGMEDVVALLYINQFVKNQDYDVLVLDCPPTGESLRFVSLPTTLEWYIKKVFKFERSALKAVRPLAKKVTNLPLPEESYFEAIEQLFLGLEGVHDILLDPTITSVRLVTSPEKMVVRETQRAFTYFSMYGLMCDALVVNRVLSPSQAGESAWHQVQEKYIRDLSTQFGDVPLLKLPWYQSEMVGKEKLSQIGSDLFPNELKDDPTQVLIHNRPFDIIEGDEEIELKVRAPNVVGQDIDMNRHQEYLTLRVGNFKRQVLLPRLLASAEIKGAKVADGALCVQFARSAS